MRALCLAFLLALGGCHSVSVVEKSAPAPVRLLEKAEVVEKRSESPVPIDLPAKNWGLDWELEVNSDFDIEVPRLRQPEFHLPSKKPVEIPHLPNRQDWRPPWIANVRPVVTGLSWSAPSLPLELPSLETKLPTLAFEPATRAKLRPRSPYCMPGHLSQNFVVFSIHDGLPLHPGVW